MSRIVIFIFTLRYLYGYCNICGSLSLRNSVTQLAKLENCSEIAGNLEIFIMLENTESDFENVVFPKLRTISGYLIFYNIPYLTSIGQLFPNLYQIRGVNLFKDFSLIIFEMPHLQQIGTTNLLSIARGAVKIDNCPNVCFVNTINWQNLGVNTVNFTKTTTNVTCEECPERCNGYCWNSNECQKPIERCHSECIGCFKPNSPKHCKVCKHFEDDGVCVNECRPGKYVFPMLNKCVTKEACQNILPGIWWINNGYCISECPEYHQVGTARVSNTDQLDYTCEYCGNNCTKTCKAPEEIDALGTLQKLLGCTHINGSLIIKMSSVEPADLYKYLGSVRNISGMFMMTRTVRVSSLDFLKNLTYIGTDTSEEMKMYANYSIFMYGNQNLQQLWNFTLLNLTLKGTIGFHNNPLLCPSEIEKLKNVTNSSYSERDAPYLSNGDKASCVTKDVNVIVSPYSTKAVLSWDPPPLEKDESYVGFTVFYKKGKDENATTFDSKDVCVVNEWTSVFANTNYTTLTNLIPNSTYSYYIKLYLSSNSSNTENSQSSLKYFQTLSDDPDGFEYLSVTPIDHQSVMLNWEKPLLPNGILAHYILDYDELADEWIFERDYCQYPKTTKGGKVDDDETESSFRINGKGFDRTNSIKLQDDNCSCAVPKGKESNIDYTIITTDRLCHTLANFGMQACKNVQYYSDDSYPVKEKIEKRNSNNQHKKIIPANETMFNVTHLRPFTLYIFYFSACNYPIEQHRCSGVLQRFARTKKKPNADDVEELTVERVTESSVKISWVAPKHPNSHIVAYHVSLTTSDSTIINSECIPVNASQKNWRQFAVTYVLLSGGYTVSVKAESLAGLSDTSKSQAFEVDSVNNHVLLMAVTITCVICFAATITLYLCFKKFKSSQLQRLIIQPNPEYEVFTSYVPDEWEMKSEDIEILHLLGHGTFGTVYQGIIKRNNYPCAVKTVNENLSPTEKHKFLTEASAMKSFNGCHHVVKLLGVVSTRDPPLVVMELMERGDLKTWLRETRDSSQNLTSNEIYRMAVEIADGMAYLAAKKFLHRDLAARNCMVAADRTVKIGDFGMARDIYETDYYRKETKGLLPVRWMAPESLADGVFTTDSDVWSYGIVLWEIATLGEQPYQGLSNEQVLQFVISRGRLTRPQECSDLLYDIMRSCWSWRPSDRPSFWDIVELLEDKVSEDFKLVSFVHSREASLYSRQRVENPPALCVEPREDLLCHYNADDEEVSLHVGRVPRRPSYLQTSLNQRRFSPTGEFY
ncbi:insulin receptor-like isoform X1 [Diorhabda sublineata]|uniref:insulin receptor-like isoform X1 n=1 Tax=Diorhabda sublineata TaxID=1163346 RepID=UPI0024E0FB39|nr:insulin receptor-like isoform X1 [Diorhabda sublineata]